MVIKSYSVTLEEGVVDDAKEQLQIGQKLSPVINELLRKWVMEQALKEVEEEFDKGEQQK